MRRFLMSMVLGGAFLLVSNPGFAASGEGQQPESIVEIPVSTNAPIPVTRGPPQYPARAARDGIEGWVLLEFFVEVDGTVSEIVILDSDPPGTFEKSAIRAVKRWRYKPAAVDGTPVRKSTQVVLSFELAGGGNVSKKYRQISDRARTAMNKGNLDEAYKLLQQLETMLLAGDGDRAHLDYQKARYYLARKDFFRATHHLRYAMRWPIRSMSKTFQHKALTTLFNAEVRLNHFSLAAETFEMLEERHLLRKRDSVHETYRQVKAILDGSTPLVSTSVLYGNKCYDCDENKTRWRYPLSRNHFQIQDVNGSIQSLRISCGYQRTSVDFDPELSWAISDKWGECELQVIGKMGTEFRLAEFD